MGTDVRRIIVVSGVNLRKGGTLTIMRQCLEYLSGHADEFRVIALVHDRKLFSSPDVEYLSMPWCARSWLLRLWAEYVSMYRISKKIANDSGRPVWLWLSMHDTTPRVIAEHQEVYCHTSFPFLKLRWRDLMMDPKIPLFACFTRWAYRINVHRNDSLIVQQEWFAESLSQLLRVPRSRFRVIPPVTANLSAAHCIRPALPTFFFASTPDCHKNFETLCEAARLLEYEFGTGRFRVLLTVHGDENRYACWLKRRWGDVQSLDFHGLMSKEELWKSYSCADCFVFPSRIETWGLPISEYASVRPDGRMLLADLPYAHETSAGYGNVRFFDADDPYALAMLMKELL